MSVPAVSFADFYDQAAIERLLDGLASARPDLVTIHRLITTPEGRDLLLAEISDASTGVGEDKPGYLVHANIHAHELTTTTAALHLAHALVDRQATDEAVAELLRRVVFYVVPRLNPDNAEWALKTNGSVRSRSYPRREPNGLTQSDVDGDGRILWLRWQDPDGDYAVHPEDPRLLIRRGPDDAGPFYRLVPEGEVYAPDGGPIHTAERRIDWNRQWPANWRPEHVQSGAGDFPFSEPEMHALGRFVIDHTNVFGMLGFHTGGHGVLRPSSTHDDQDLDRADVALLREVGQKGAELTGFPLFSVREYCTNYSADAKLWGHFTDWSYDHLGTLTFEIELGNLYNSAGVSTEQFKEATPRERELYQLAALRWSEEHDYGAFVDWRPFEHPQLGEVEIGGWIRYRLANPALPHLESICEGCTAFILHHASLAPRLEIRTEVTDFGGVYRLRVEAVNPGALPTHIMQQGSKLRHVRGVRVTADPGDGVEMLSRVGSHEIGHLARLNGKREAEWFVRGGSGGVVTITAACPRAGKVTAEISLG